MVTIESLLEFVKSVGGSVKMGSIKLVLQVDGDLDVLFTSGDRDEIVSWSPSPRTGDCVDAFNEMDSFTKKVTNQLEQKRVIEELSNRETKLQREIDSLKSRLKNTEELHIKYSTIMGLLSERDLIIHNNNN